MFNCRKSGHAVEFQRNTALVHFSAPKDALLSILREECQGCAWFTLCQLPAANTQVLFNSTSPTNFRVSLNGTDYLEGYHDFLSLGTYNISNSHGKTIIETVGLPDSQSHGITVLSMFFLLFCVSECIPWITIYKYMRWICFRLRGWLYSEVESIDEEEDERPVVDTTSRRRLKYIDVSRGIAIVLMIFVNYGGGGFNIFEHSSWDGFTIADFVFPHFLFIVGVSYGLTMKRRLSLRSSLLVFRRTAKLFFIGLLLSKSRSWESLRMFGVLQRIALSHCVFHLIRLFIHRVLKEKQPESVEEEPAEPIHDVSTNLWKESVVVWSMCLALTAAELVFPLPGCPRFYLGPGGLASNGTNRNCTGGLNYMVDVTLVGKSHLYQKPTCKDPYMCPNPYDPEGLIGTLMAVFNVYSGFFFVYLLRAKSKTDAARWIVSSTLICLVLALMFHATFLPINKNLWSFSYCLVTVALSSSLTFVLFLVIDVKKYLAAPTLQSVGQHALTLYILHILFRNCVPVNWSVGPDSLSQTLIALWGVCFHIIVARVLTYAEVFFSV